MPGPALETLKEDLREGGSTAVLAAASCEGDEPAETTACVNYHAATVSFEHKNLFCGPS